MMDAMKIMNICRNRIRCIAVYTVLLSALSLAVAFYSYGAEILRLEQAVEIAVKNNPALRAADAEVEAARAGVLRSASGFLPKVTISKTYSRTDNPLMVFGTKLNQEVVSMSDFDPAGINNPEAISNYNTRLSVMQPVWNGGREYIGVRQAKIGREAALYSRERARQETVYNVIKAYYGLLLAKKNLNVAQKSLETSEENMKLAEARYRAGAVLQSDYLRAKVQYAEVKEMVTRSENGVKLAKAALNFAMGVAQSMDYDIEGSLSIQTIDRDLEELIKEALSKRPDIVALELNRKNAEANVSQAKTDYLPSLNVMAQIDFNSKTPGGDDAKSWAVMAVLSWNIFDGLTTMSKVQEAAASAQKIKALEGQMRSAAELQVRRAYYDFISSIDRIAATATSVKEAEEGFRIVQKRYQAGMTNFVDVLGAENALIRAKTNALQALYDNNIAHAELKLAVGTL